MELSDIQKAVMEAARVRLEHEPWFEGICMDDFPTERECREDFDGAVSMVRMATQMWDDPNFFSK